MSGFYVTFETEDHSISRNWNASDSIPDKGEIFTLILRDTEPPFTATIDEYRVKERRWQYDVFNSVLNVTVIIEPV